MNKFLTKIRDAFWVLFPQRLPTGSVDDLNAFCTRLLGYYDIPDLAPYHEAVANFIMHLKHDVAHIRPSSLAACVRKAMANEVCYQYLQEQRDARAKAKPALSVAKDGSINQNPQG